MVIESGTLDNSNIAFIISFNNIQSLVIHNDVVPQFHYSDQFAPLGHLLYLDLGQIVQSTPNMSFPPRMETLIANSFTELGVFEESKQIKHVTVNKVTVIPESCFESTELVSLHGESIETISETAMRVTNSLESVYAPKIKTIRTMAFHRSSLSTFSFNKVEHLEMAAFSYSNITSIELGPCTLNRSAFIGCANLVTVTLHGVETIPAQCFSGCKSLVSITGAEVLLIKTCAFMSCTSLATVTMPSVENVEDGAFMGTGRINILFPKIATLPSSAFRNSRILSFSAPSCSKIGSFAFSGCESLEAISVNLTMLVAEAHSFEKCVALQSIESIEIRVIPDSFCAGCVGLVTVTILTAEEINSRAFASCSSLVSITAPNVKRIGIEAFANCTMLHSFSFLEVYGIESRGFQECTSIRVIDMPALTLFDSSAFIGCSMIETVDLQSIASIKDNGFKNCNNLRNVTAPNLTQVGYSVFQGCSRLEWIEHSLINIGRNAFNGCDSLKEFRFLPGTVGEGAFAQSGLVNITFACELLGGYNFFQCRDLVNVSVSMLCPSLPKYVFANCPNLLSVIVHTVQVDEGAFENCSTLRLVSFDTYEINMLFEPRVFFNTGFKSVMIETNVFCSYFFSHCAKLELVIFTGQVVDSYALSDCPRLKSVKIIECDEIRECAFRNCSSLESVDIGICTHIGKYAFAGTNISLPLVINSLSKPVVIETGAFSETNICRVDISSACNITKCFENCPSLVSVALGHDARVTGAFTGCTNLKSVTIESGTLGDDSFSNCCALESITAAVSCIGSHCFAQCSQLSDAVFQQQIDELGQSAFSDCASLVSISLKVNKISKKCFFQCTKLKEISTTATELEANAFQGSALVAFDFARITTIPDEAFLSCARLLRVEFANIMYVGISAFANCVSLTSVSAVGADWTCADFAFANCSTLTSISSDSLTAAGEGAFRGCTALEKVNLSRLVGLRSYAFEGCASLVDVTFPAVESFSGPGIFANCTNLTRLAVKSLSVVDSDCLQLFDGCSSLRVIALPDARAPKTFHNRTFDGLEVNLLVKDLDIYDDDISIDGDRANDGRWCGIKLSIGSDWDHMYTVIIVVVGVLFIVAGVAMYNWIKYRMRYRDELSQQHDARVLQLAILADFG